MTGWVKMPAGSKFNGTCSQCNAPYGIGSPLWFIKGASGYFDSYDCMTNSAKAKGIVLDAPQGPTAGQTPEKGPTPAPAAIGASTGTGTPAGAYCDVCGEALAGPTYAVERKGEEHRLCRYCYMTRRRTYLLKKHGLWPFVAKGEEIERTPVCPVCGSKMKLLNENNEHFPPSWVCVGECVDKRQLKRDAQDVKA